MESYFLTILSIFVSVVLFIISYRRIVSARRERVQAANTEMERILLKRIILESYKPAVNEISRVIEGKAQDFNLNKRYLKSESQLLNTLFTRIMESDFITPEKRIEIFSRLSPVLQKAEETPMEMLQASELPSAKKRFLARNIMPILLGIVASITGTLIAIIPKRLEIAQFNTTFIIVGFIASLFIISIIFAIYRMREEQEEITSESSLLSAVKFEKEVTRALKKANVSFTIGGRDIGADFIAKFRGKKFLIEVKAWSYSPPISVVQSVSGAFIPEIRVFPWTSKSKESY